MTELKTLKFCGNRIGYEGSVCKNCGTPHSVTEEWLRAEAIKWIKKFKQDFDKNGDYSDQGAQLAFMHFFDLTEEDLK